MCQNATMLEITCRGSNYNTTPEMAKAVVLLCHPSYPSGNSLVLMVVPYAQTVAPLFQRYLWTVSF